MTEEDIDLEKEIYFDLDSLTEDVKYILSEYFNPPNIDAPLQHSDIIKNQVNEDIEILHIDNTAKPVTSEFIPSITSLLKPSELDLLYKREKTVGNTKRTDITYEATTFDTKIHNDDSYIVSLLSSEQSQSEEGLTFYATIADDYFIGTVNADTIIYSSDTINTDTDIINLGDGNDILQSTVDFWISNNSHIRLGSGNDTINALEILLSDNTIFDTGSGNDHFNISEIYLFDNTLLDTGSGNDTIVGEVGVDDDASISLGAGDDTITGSFWLFSNTDIDLGDGNDVIRITNTGEALGLYLGSTINFGNGDDILDSGNSVPYLQGDIYFGDGNDTFLGDYLYFSSSRAVYMGDGNDIINTGTQGDYNFDNADIFLGNGDDILYIKGTGEIEQAWGDAGADQFIFSYIGGDTTLNDFDASEGDVIDISQILTGYDADTDNISDFARFLDVGADTELQIDADGGADGFITLATLMGGAGLDALTLEISGNLNTSI